MSGPNPDPDPPGPGPDPGPDPEPEPEPPTSPVPGIPSFPGSLNAGSGGLMFWRSIVDMAGFDISSYGNIDISATSHITADTVMVSHRNCGSSSSYGALCTSSPAPIRLTTAFSGNGSLTANTVCGPRTPIASGSVLNVTNLRTDCTPTGPPPNFDKQALTSTIPSGNVSAGFYCNGGNRTIQANRRYNDKITAVNGCTITVTGNGVIYIEGNFQFGDDTVLQFDSSVTQPVTFVVNGMFEIGGDSIFGSPSSPRPNVISFDSDNWTCVESPTCSTISTNDLYKSREIIAIDLFAGYSYANLYAPFGKIIMNGPELVEAKTVFGQAIEIRNSNGSNEIFEFK